jgi:hypothetical protein
MALMTAETPREHFCLPVQFVVLLVFFPIVGVACCLGQAPGPLHGNQIAAFPQEVELTLNLKTLTPANVDT